jgi:predicted RNase H-like nuclease (RuvC/YqgF family)
MQTKQILSLLNQLESEISDLRRVNYEQHLELKGYRLIERLLGGGDVQGMCVDVLHELKCAKAQLTEQLEGPDMFEPSSLSLKDQMELIREKSELVARLADLSQEYEKLAQQNEYKEKSIKSLRASVLAAEGKVLELDRLVNAGNSVSEIDSLGHTYGIAMRVRFDHTLEGVIKSIKGDTVVIEDDSRYVWTRKLSDINGPIDL